MTAMDEFDTPTLINIPSDTDNRQRKAGKRGRIPIGDQARRARKAVGDGIQRALAEPATIYAQHAAERREARTPDARAAVIEANVKRRDALRDLRRDRKAFEAAREEAGWWNVWNGERRAARAVVRDSAALAREAGNACREAKKAYPLTMPALAVRCTVAHLLPTGFWAAVSDSVASSVAAGTSVAAALLTAATAYVARGIDVAARNASVAGSLTPTAVEKELMRRLDPKVWLSVAAPRGLNDVLPAAVKLSESGITAKLTLAGQMSVTKLKGREDDLRAALSLPSKVRLEVWDGDHGGRAKLVLRTRSAADGVTMNGWAPGQPWGINTVTGNAVTVPLGRRMLIAGTSGSGKSWSARPILAEASEHDDHRLVILDMKRIEARLWKHRARIAITPEEILTVVEELVAEMYERLDRIPDGEDVVQISPSLPRITVFVDEGSELISESKKKEDKETGFDPGQILEGLRTLARMGRAAEIIILWATQKPMLSGDSPGLDSQISAQVTCRLSLAVATQTDTRVIFGEDAVTKGWLAHELPMPGVAMLRDSNSARPDQIKMRAVSPKDVMNLPPRAVWSRRASWTGATAEDIRTRVSMEKAVPVQVSAAERDRQLLDELRREPCRSIGDLARALGINKGTVKKRLDAMYLEGVVRRDGNGCWHPVS